MRVRIEFDTDNAPGWGARIAFALRDMAGEWEEMGSGCELAQGAKITANVEDGNGTAIGKCEVTE